MPVGLLRAEPPPSRNRTADGGGHGIPFAGRAGQLLTQMIEGTAKVTYHPSYLLRLYNQEAKREAWEDLKNVYD